MLKAAIYCRISEEDKNKMDFLKNSESIENQKSLLLRYIIEQNWDLYKIYIDENYSGIDSKRPEFNNLIKDAEKHKFDIILCKTQSRFTRDIEIVEKYLHNKFSEWGIRFITIVDGADTSDINNKKSRQINGLINQWYLEDLSENIKLVLNNKMRDGKYIGANCPYGYKKSCEKNKMEIDEEASKIVKDIFQMYLNGYGINEITKYLNINNILNPTAYKINKGLNYYNPNYKYNQNNLWGRSTIRSILCNEVYIGNLIQGKTRTINYKSRKVIHNDKEKWIRVNNTHKPIIDIQDYFIVQEKLKNNLRQQKENGKIHIFAGKVFCMECKSKLYKHIDSRKNEYLECVSRRLKNEDCAGNSIKIKDLENIVLKEINNILCKFDLKDDIFNSIEEKSMISYKKQVLVQKKEKLKNKIEDIKHTLKSLYIDKTKGIVSEIFFVEVNNDFIFEIQELENSINKINIELSLKENIDINMNKNNIIQKYNCLESLNRNIIEELIDKIYIKVEQGNKKRYRNRIIEICWKF